MRSLELTDHIGITSKMAYCSQYTQSVRIALSEWFNHDADMLSALLKMNLDQLHALMDTLCPLFATYWYINLERIWLSTTTKFLLINHQNWNQNLNQNQHQELSEESLESLESASKNLFPFVKESFPELFPACESVLSLSYYLFKNI